jgi:hypothetical protein
LKKIQEAMKVTMGEADMLCPGAIGAPLNRRWAQEVVEEMGAFTYGEYDDLHGAGILGLLRLRRGGFRTADPGGGRRLEAEAGAGVLLRG